MTRLIFTSIVISILFTRALFAESYALKCDREQTYCVAENKRLITGDKVGIFNANDELVAVAEVSGMEGKKRRLNIERKVGLITDGSQAKQIHDEDLGSLEQKYTLYREPAKMNVGADISAMKFDVANAQAFAIEAYAEQRGWKKMLMVGRVQAFSASGRAIDEFGDDQSFTATGLSVLPGVAYRLLTNKPVILRPEANLGLAYISSSNTGANVRAVDRIGSGFVLGLRAGCDAIYNTHKDYEPFATAAFTQYNDSRIVNLGVGVNYRLK